MRKHAWPVRSRQIAEGKKQPVVDQAVMVHIFGLPTVAAPARCLLQVKHVGGWREDDAVPSTAQPEAEV